jgi:hypothetical protein
MNANTVTTLIGNFAGGNGGTGSSGSNGAGGTAGTAYTYQQNL